jgi:hypothetical protein
VLIYDYCSVPVFASLVGWMKKVSLGSRSLSDADMMNVHAVSGRAGPAAIPCPHVIAG